MSAFLEVFNGILIDSCGNIYLATFPVDSRPIRSRYSAIVISVRGEEGREGVTKGREGRKERGREGVREG